MFKKLDAIKIYVITESGNTGAAIWGYASCVVCLALPASLTVKRGIFWLG